MDNLAITILPLAGVIVGAALQFWLSRTAEREKQVESRRIEAYVDYLKSVADSAHLRSDSDLRDAHRAAAYAKTRIAAYRGAQVINAMAKFENVGPKLDNVDSVAAFVHLVSVMRPNMTDIVERDIELILFGKLNRQMVAPHSQE